MPFLILAFKLEVASLGSAAERPTISARNRRRGFRFRLDQSITRHGKSHAERQRKPRLTVIRSEGEILRSKTWSHSPNRRCRDDKEIRSIFFPFSLLSSRANEKRNLNVLTIFPDFSCEWIIGCLQQCHDIVIQWIHVLHQPLFSSVFHFTRIMDDTEVSRCFVIGFT